MAKTIVKKPRRVFRKKPCYMCKEKIDKMDFKETAFLSKYISDRGKIMPTRVTGNCTKHQRIIANAIKQARIAALLPFVKIKSGLARRGGRRQS